jgi:hypothetical protein
VEDDSVDLPTPEEARALAEQKSCADKPLKRVPTSLSYPLEIRLSVIVISGAHDIELSELPDPHGYFADLVKKHPELGATKVVHPEIRDATGRLLTALEWQNFLTEGRLVCVNYGIRL